MKQFPYYSNWVLTYFIQNVLPYMKLDIKLFLENFIPVLVLSFSLYSIMYKKVYLQKHYAEEMRKFPVLPGITRKINCTCLYETQRLQQQRASQSGVEEHPTIKPN